MLRIRPRISLLTALLLLTIAGLAIVVVQLWREVGPLRGEVRALRQIVGQLSIDDDTKVHGIEVRHSDPYLWRWRLYLPPGPQYKLVQFGGNLPPRGTLSNKKWLAALRNSSIGSGEITSNQFEGEFTFDVSFAPVNDRWTLQMYPPGGESQSQYAFTENWPADLGRIEYSDIRPTQQRVFEPGEPILLLHLSKPNKVSARFGGGTKAIPPTEPAEGIAIWLEPPPVNSQP